MTKQKVKIHLEKALQNLIRVGIPNIPKNKIFLRKVLIEQNQLLVLGGGRLLIIRYQISLPLQKKKFQKMNQKNRIRQTVILKQKGLLSLLVKELQEKIKLNGNRVSLIPYMKIEAKEIMRIKLMKVLFMKKIRRKLMKIIIQVLKQMSSTMINI